MEKMGMSKEKNEIVEIDATEEKARTLNQSIIKIRVDLQNKKLKKSGKNKFAGFEYFELADFLPTLNELMQAEEINDIFTIEDEYARLILIKGNEQQEYKIPFKMFTTPVNAKGIKSMQDIQYLGALNTYYKRYLYLNAFGITDGEVIDSMDNSQLVDEMEVLRNKIKSIPNSIETLKKYGKNLSSYTKEELESLIKELEGGNNE